jgi:RNA polymerase sigma factor (sigma-70 family)
MSTTEPLTCWLEQWKAGDSEAAQKLWEHYFEEVVNLARRKLQGAPRRAADEEDVAQNAFMSLCRGMERKRFPKLDDREDLWRLLVVITKGKAFDLAAQERAQKRGGGFHAASDFDFENLFSKEPTPEFASQVAEEYQRLLAKLEDAELRQIALWKMEGDTNEEIAEKLGCVLRTVERRLNLIRKMWSAEIGP